MLCQLEPVKATAIIYGQIMGLKVASCQLGVFLAKYSLPHLTGSERVPRKPVQIEDKKPVLP